MPSKDDPTDSLSDIIENAERIESYLLRMDRDHFEGNGLVRDAGERCMERVCEAAYRLGDRATELMPGQPWGDIRGMGNRLRHAYDRIGLDVLWNAVRYDLPGLAADARRVLERLRAEQGGNR
ncbi:MAG: HepT-like ribonuclease domain-containing protein [Acetobacteraceae bacterium]